MKKTIASRVTITILLLLFVATLVLFLRELKINNSYTNYEKEQMHNDLTGFILSILQTNQILNSASQSGKFTIGDANFLSNDFNTQGENFNNMAQRAQLQNKNVDETTSMAANCMSIYVCRDILHVSGGVFDMYSSKANQEIILTDTQKNMLKAMLAINNNWVKILDKDVKGISGDTLENSFDSEYEHSKYTDWYKMIDDFVTYSYTIDKGTINSLQH
jgi:hypothetical protein